MQPANPLTALLSEIPGETSVEILASPAAPAFPEVEGRTVSLDEEFAPLMARPSPSVILLGNPADRLPMITLRRFVHRATRWLEPGGRFALVTSHRDRFWDDEPLPWPGESSFRPLRQLVELLRLFPCEITRIETKDGWMVIGARKTDPETAPSFLQATEAETKYGVESDYHRFDRMEEPEILDDLLYSMARLRPRHGDRVLGLGVNDGKELALLSEVIEEPLEIWGIDHAGSAIGKARERLPEHSERLLVADLADLSRLDLPRFEVVLLLNVLHCRTVDREQVLRDLDGFLAEDARILISLPDCHFGPSDILRRPLDREDPRHDRSPVLKDVRYLARHFYRQGFRKVETFGTYDLFLVVQR